MKYLAENYNVVHMEHVLDRVLAKTSFPERAVLITFDDAYLDFAEFAWPTLRHYRLPVTLFVPTSYADGTLQAFWWDRLHAAFVRTHRRRIYVRGLGELVLADHKKRALSLKKLQNHVKSLKHDEALTLVDAVCADLDYHHDLKASILNWEQLHFLSKAGVTLGAHTRTHPLLTKVPLDRVRSEVRGSFDDLQERLGDVLPIFAYPSGDHNAAITAILKDEGIKLAVTTMYGFNEMCTADPLRLHRININQRTTPTMFRLRLLKAVSWIEQFRH